MTPWNQSTPYKIFCNPVFLSLVINDQKKWVLTKRSEVLKERQYKGELLSLLLDSKLITPVRFQKYSYKLVDCGDYLQVYYYKNARVRQNLEKLDILDLKKSCRCTNSGKIEQRNIIRTKLNCQRLAKANSKEWNSFITLTYKENMQDVKQAKKDLEYFITNIKKIKKDFKYISIPEFQKRGSIHFHLLTNLPVDSIFIPKRPIKKIFNPKTKKWKELEYYNILYWNEDTKGFSSAEKIAGDVKKIVGYISKYMTEDCDERLFNFRRFSSSQNLRKPNIDYLSMKDKMCRKWFINAIKDKECIYSNIYYDKFDNEVQFMEFLKG